MTSAVPRRQSDVVNCEEMVLEQRIHKMSALERLHCDRHEILSVLVNSEKSVDWCALACPCTSGYRSVGVELSFPPLPSYHWMNPCYLRTRDRCWRSLFLVSSDRRFNGWVAVHWNLVWVVTSSQPACSKNTYWFCWYWSSCRGPLFACICTRYLTPVTVSAITWLLLETSEIIVNGLVAVTLSASWMYVVSASSRSC